MRIVPDTNIVLSALPWQGAPRQLLTAIGQQPRVQIFSSAALLDELADVLTRTAASRRLALSGKTAADVLTDYVEAVNLVDPTNVPRVVAGDADDDQVIAAAVAARADIAVTGDCRHLLPIGNHQGIAIVEAVEAIRRLAV